MLRLATCIRVKTGTCTKASGVSRRTLLMDLASKLGQKTVGCTKAISKLVSLHRLEFSLVVKEQKKAISITEDGERDSLKVMELSHGVMGESILENGLTIIITVRERCIILTGVGIKETTSKVCNRAKGR
jgi:hypothetical protein